MDRKICRTAVSTFALILACLFLPAVRSWAQTGTLTAQSANKVVTEADCTAEKLGDIIPVSAIGEPVSGVTLNAFVWKDAAGSNPAYCSVTGSMAPVSKDINAMPINFQVVLPASWSRRAAQLGGAGMDGMIPNLLGGADMGPGPSLIQQGFATYGSDSGHQMSFGFGFGRGRTGGLPGEEPAARTGDAWALNDEAMKNIGYMQLKKTHDAAMILIERIYGEKPRFNYFFGSSQGGREALTVAQRYPADYDGVAANVPIVNFSSLMLAPELIRIQEKPLADWVTPAKVNAIRGEFMRQCDGLDGLVDGIINNYTACRAIFDVKQGAPGRNPWSAKRCPDNKDPDPADNSTDACLTDGQIATLEFVYSRYMFATPLANDVKSFGMWLPNTDPSGSGLIEPNRFRGQEGAPENARMHSHLGILGVTGFLMQDLSANPLDYVEGGSFDARRREISLSLDSTDPDLEPFLSRGGKMIVAIGTNDTLASPGAQLDYYQSVLDKMGREKVDKFARFFVLPQTGHGLSGTNYSIDGEGKSIPVAPIPNAFNRFDLLVDWVEKNTPPPMAVTVKAGNRSLPMCSYPSYPKYTGGPVEAAASYVCAAPEETQKAGAGKILIPHPSWTCGMAEGIPVPEQGVPVFEADLKLDQSYNLGRTPYGLRDVYVIQGGTVSGGKIHGSVMPGGLDFQLSFSNGGMEIEQILVLKTDDGRYIYMRSPGTAADRSDIRIVPDFEAPNASDYDWLNTGKFAGRRVVDPAKGTIRISVFDVSGVPAATDKANSVLVTKPADVRDQPWEFRKAAPGEKRGEQLIRENVTLGAGQSVGASKRGNRNIIPITGGIISGKITGKVLPGGADYQNLSNPPTIDARYLWQTSDGEVIIVRNGGSFGSLAPAFEARVDGKYAWLNEGRYLSSDPVMGSGGVSLTFYESEK